MPLDSRGTNPLGYEHVEANTEKSRLSDDWAYHPPLLNSGTVFYIPDLVFFFVFFNGVAAPTLTGPTRCTTRLTTVFNALFLIALPFNGTTTNRTQLLNHFSLLSQLLSFMVTKNYLIYYSILKFATPLVCDFCISN
jgi:hypothetical protein